MQTTVCDGNVRDVCRVIVLPTGVLGHKRCHQHATSTFAYQLLSNSVATDLLSLLLAMASRATFTRYLSKACCKKGSGFRVWGFKVYVGP